MSITPLNPEELYEVATRLVTKLQKVSRDAALNKYEDVIQDMVLAAHLRGQEKPIGRPVVEQEMRKVFFREREKESRRVSQETHLDSLGEHSMSVHRSEAPAFVAIEEELDAKTALRKWMEVLDATELQRKVVAGLLRYDMDRERTAQELRVSRGTVDSVLQNLRTKAAKYVEARKAHPTQGAPQDQPRVPDAGVAQGAEGPSGEAPGLSGVRDEAEASARPPLSGGGEGPGAHGAADAVSELPRDSGDHREAEQEPPHPSAPAPVVAARASEAAGASGRRLTALDLITYWVHRSNPYALMSPAGTGYYPVREELTLEVLERHLAGEVTVGVYSTREDNTVKWVCWDIDVTDIEQVMALVMVLDGPYLVEFSGNKGYHVWQFFAEPVDAGVALAYGQSAAERAGVQCEVFPKQADIKGGLGNLVKLPGGVHRKTGNRAEVKQGELAFIPVPTGEAHAAKGEPVATPQSEAVSGWIGEMFTGGLAEGGRNNTLNRFVAWLLSREIPPDVVESTVRFVNENYCEPPLDEDELGLLLRPRRFAA